VDLGRLRQVLSIIPQEPVLFNGDLRYNLDPYDQHTDAELWLALEQAKLGPYIKEQALGLKMEVASGGTNFSTGQRQLVCLARALLKKSKILILDEATASVDVGTDALIQETIAEAFRDVTVLAIAHRLNTIISSDKIMVLDNGVAAEYAHPDTLLSDEKSIFSSMVDNTGKANATILRRVAKGELDWKEAISAAAEERDQIEVAKTEEDFYLEALGMGGGSQDTKKSITPVVAEPEPPPTPTATKKKNPRSQLLELKSAISSMLEMENQVAERGGHVDFGLVSQLALLAAQLTNRVNERYASAHSEIESYDLF
jgi:ABC-type multidrug transport system ATPase subunit